MPHFSLVYGCVFIPAEWAPITRFQRLWQQPSVRKPNTSQLRQCTQADAQAHTHTRVCTRGSNYTQTHWHNAHGRDERANLSNHQPRQAWGRIVPALVWRKRARCSCLHVCNFDFSFFSLLLWQCSRSAQLVLAPLIFPTETHHLVTLMSADSEVILHGIVRWGGDKERRWVCWFVGAEWEGEDWRRFGRSHVISH